MGAVPVETLTGSKSYFRTIRWDEQLVPSDRAFRIPIINGEIVG